MDEGGDRTVARAVLHTEAPLHVEGRGETVRNPADRDVPEIGDEVAAARALHDLADALLARAAGDISAVEEAPGAPGLRRAGRSRAVTGRAALGSLGLGAGTKARLHRILFEHGLKNGTALFLPYDQGLEHGPRDFLDNPPSSDARYLLRLALEGGFNGIVLQVGLAEKFFWEFAGEVPLVLKLNGKTDIPPDDEALSSMHASVEDAVRLGADAVGYTLYLGSPAYDVDFARLRQVREDAQRLGMPLIVWSYPRGSAVATKGGNDSFYVVDYAARVASEPVPTW